MTRLRQLLVVSDTCSGLSEEPWPETAVFTVEAPRGQAHRTGIQTGRAVLTKRPGVGVEVSGGALHLYPRPRTALFGEDSGCVTPPVDARRRSSAADWGTSGQRASAPAATRLRPSTSTLRPPNCFRSRWISMLGWRKRWMRTRSAQRWRRQMEHGAGRPLCGHKRRHAGSKRGSSKRWPWRRMNSGPRTIWAPPDGAGRSAQGAYIAVSLRLPATSPKGSH